MISFIVIADDDESFNNVREVVLRYMMKNDYEFNFVRANLDELLYLDNDSINIYVIDSNKYDIIAKEIRKFDWASPIIILKDTNYTSFSVNRLQILDIIEKDNNVFNNLYELFDICFRQLKIKSSFKYKIGKVHYTLNYDKILYIYKDTIERKCVIVTDKNEYKIPLTLSKVYNLLPKNFVYSHKSCIVNLERIDAFNWSDDKIVFDNCKSIGFLSKSHKEELIGQNINKY